MSESEDGGSLKFTHSTEARCLSGRLSAFTRRRSCMCLYPGNPCARARPSVFIMCVVVTSRANLVMMMMRKEDAGRS